MKTIERPGIDPKWKSLWKRNRRAITEIIESGRPRIARELEHYALYGRTLMAENQDPEPLVPPLPGLGIVPGV
jgi:hypothetical protein